MPDPNTTTPTPDGDAVERAARALHDEMRSNEVPWEFHHESYRAIRRDQARAALAAAREPAALTLPDEAFTPGPGPAPNLTRLADRDSDPEVVARRRYSDGPRATASAMNANASARRAFVKGWHAALAARPPVPTVTALPPSRSLHGQGANEPWHFEHRPPTVTATEVREAARVLYEQAAADDWSGWENEPDEVQRTWIARVHDSAVALRIEVTPCAATFEDHYLRGGQTSAEWARGASVPTVTAERVEAATTAAVAHEGWEWEVAPGVPVSPQDAMRPLVLTVLAALGIEVQP